MEQGTQQTHVSIGEKQYEIKDKESVNLSTQAITITTTLTSKDGTVYRLVPVNEVHPDGKIVTTGYMEAHAVGGKGIMRHGKQIVKLFLVAGILEHVGYFED